MMRTKVFNPFQVPFCAALDMLAGHSVGARRRPYLPADNAPASHHMHSSLHALCSYSSRILRYFGLST